jgi:hypothetical protein
MSWAEVEDWLNNPRADSFRDQILDDAVLGCLELNVMDEALEDFGFIVSVKTRQKFGQLIDNALSKGM